MGLECTNCGWSQPEDAGRCPKCGGQVSAGAFGATSPAPPPSSAPAAAVKPKAAPSVAVAPKRVWVVMILPAVACENCDGPDAGQKALAFVYQKPLHMLGYLLIGLIGLLLGYLFASLFAMLYNGIHAPSF